MTPQRARELVAFCDRIAWLLDDCLRVPGTPFRFGIDAVIGLVPLAGDAAGFLLSSLTLFRAHRAGVPKSVLARMGGNVALDFVGSAVPVIGDVFDTVFKAHRRNFELLRKEYAPMLPSYAAPHRRAHWAVRVLAGVLFAAIGWGVWHAFRH